MPVTAGRPPVAGGSGLATDDEVTAAIAAYAAPLASLRGLTAPPLRDVTVTAKGSDPTPVAVFGGYLYGVTTTTIYRSANAGASWSSYITGAPSGILKMIPTDDDEVVAVTPSTLYRTSGWGSSPTWTAKATANGNAYFLNWGLDGDGTKFITTEYAAGVDFPDSRYVRLSTDKGVTWTTVYDSEDVHGSTAADASHLHGCCYDPWSDRFYISEGHGDIAGVYYSDDDGATWTRAAGMVANPSPTVLVATDDGLVAGTDNTDAGLFGVLRRADGDDETLTKTWHWRTGAAGLIGFATHGFRDPDTGLVYVGFRAAYTSTPPTIAAGTASSGSEVWRHDTVPVTASDDVSAVFVPSTGVLVAVSYISPTTNIIRARLGRPGASDATLQDSGRVLGGTAPSGDALAVGRLADTNDSIRSVAVGPSATTTGDQDEVAIGYQAATAASSCVAVGASTDAAAQGTAVGYNAQATVGQATALGYNASAGNSSGTALGNSASVVGSAGTAVGKGATVASGHSGSVAVGYNQTTTAAAQLRLGGVHTELTEVTDPAAPSTNAARLYVRDTGGKTELVVRFATGAIQQIAIEP